MEMTKEQMDRYLDIQEQKVEAITNVSYALHDVASSITGSYDGSKSAFWGISQALFMMVGEMEGGGGTDCSLKVKILKDDE